MFSADEEEDAVCFYDGCILRGKEEGTADVACREAPAGFPAVGLFDEEFFPEGFNFGQEFLHSNSTIFKIKALTKIGLSPRAR